MTPALPRRDALAPRGRLVAVGLAVLLVVAGAAAVAFGNPLAPDGGTDSVQFREVSASCGLDYETTGAADGSDDGAVAVADYDRDGWPDLLALGGGPTLYENTGSGFERAGALPDGEYPAVKSALFFDADGDGWRDLLLVPRTGEPVFLENERGEFARADAGFDAALKWGTGASAADYDRDGDLDVFLTQNGDWREDTPRRSASGGATGGYPNLLYENTGSGFERVRAGVAGNRWSLASSFVDLTGDGYPDVHVANDYARDVLLVNRRNGTFERRPVPGTNRHGMASVVRDVDGDGRLDLFVTNVEFPNPQEIWELNSGLNVRNRGNTLLLNRGNGTFAERATAYGVREGGWGWSAAVEDFDNDGTLDVLHATKYYLERTAGAGFDGVETRPSLWEARPNGTFDRRNASAAGLVTSNGRGLATLDFDRDGDRDVAVADTSNRFKLYENVDDGGNWVQVRVRAGDGTAVGTRVRVVTGEGTTVRVQSSRSGFFSQSTRTLHFGLGSATVERIRVVRPDGTERVFEDVAANRRYVVTANGSLTTPDVGPGDC
ncbi:MAG: CRTAC1 family protein [Haloarculaceae archaeon]